MVAVFGRSGEAERVGIEKGILRPREYFTRLHIGDEHAAPFGLGFTHGLCNDFFRDELDLHVQGEMEILALSRAGAVGIESAPRAVSLHDVFPGGPRKKLVERALNPFQPHIVQPYEAEQLAGQMLERIYTFIFPGKSDAGQRGAAYGAGRGVVNLAAYPDEGTVLFQLLLERSGIQPQNGSKGKGGMHGVPNFTGVGIDRTHLHAAGQNLIIAVIYGSPPRFHQLGVGMLAHGLFGEFRPHDELDVKSPAPQHDPDHGKKTCGDLKTQSLPVEPAAGLPAAARL